MSVDQTQLPTQAAPPVAPDPNGAVAPDETSGAKTVEEVEAYWRNRVSKKDQAHQAAETALNRQLEQARAQATVASTAAPSSDGQPGTSNTAEAALRRQIEETQKALEAEKAARVIDQRKAQYPALAKAGTEDEVFASASEATLARLNALADDEPSGTFIAPTGPKRGQPAPPKKLSEMTKQELLDQLRLATEGQKS